MAKKREPDNLDMDAAKAKASGMSYGRWKADHPHTKDYDIYIPAPKTKKCEACGGDMPMRGRAQKYCCEECAFLAKLMRDKEHKQRKKEREQNGS